MKVRWLFAILALAFLFVLMPFLFWQATWFGRPLDDAQLRKSLQDREHPREIQHALSQIADRILARDPPTRQSALPFYPEVIRIAATGTDELRLTAAWVMGQDDSVPEFHQQLLQLLRDPHPMVRRNAALSLVRFGDFAGRDEIRSMLRPYNIEAPLAGSLDERLKPGDTLNPGTLVGRIDSGKAKTEMRSQVPGTIERWLVADHASVAPGDPVLVVLPDVSEIWQGLRALDLIGEAGDLSMVEDFARGAGGMPPGVRQQAELTANAIRSRNSH